ncbi:MAG: hypothetical protein L6V78_00390 [Clostridium sp.]|nr:MAG: hypothetical protein L6V78_00390 [Clostridium sp.]
MNLIMSYLKKVMDLSTIEFSNKILIVLPSNTLEESPTITDLPKKWSSYFN